MIWVYAYLVVAFLAMLGAHKLLIVCMYPWERLDYELNRGTRIVMWVSAAIGGLIWPYLLFLGIQDWLVYRKKKKDAVDE